MIINTESHDHWGTPKELYDKLDSEFKFDFDPCPMHSTFDGLVIPWGKVNFVNPPYNRFDKPKFIKKAFEEWKLGKIVVMLLPVCTSGKDFHRYIYPFAEIRFLEKRVRFLENGTKQMKTGTRDNMIVIFK